MRVVIFILIVSCGEPHGKPQVVADFNGEQAEIIFARKASNGQYCFYANTVEKELLSKGLPLLKDQASEQDGDQSSFTKLEEKQVDFSKISEGSTLLTERSVSSNDLKYPLTGSTKWSNIMTKTSYIPYNIPLSFGCFAGLVLLSTPVGWLAVSCVPLIASYAMSLRAGVKALAEGRRKLNAAVRLEVYRDPLLLQELRKIFQWLESENSIECPAQPRIAP